MQIKTSNYLFEGSYEELVAELSADTFWMRFFIRPCCPKPDEKGADRYLDTLRQEIESKDELDSAQIGTLASLIDDGEHWYKSRFCR